MYHYIDEQLTWHEAEARCNALGGTLTSAHGEEGRNGLQSFLHDDAVESACALALRYSAAAQYRGCYYGVSLPRGHILGRCSLPEIECFYYGAPSRFLEPYRPFSGIISASSLFTSRSHSFP